jgi:hypothetical protein
VQWFGRDLDAVWYGEGMARLVGEFDEDLKTGFYWYDDPKIKFPWFPTAVTEIYLPPKQPGLSRREPLRVEQKRTKRRQPRKPTTVGNSTADSN